MKENFERKKITVEAYGETYTFEGDLTNIDDWAEVVAKMLYSVGFADKTIKEMFRE